MGHYGIRMFSAKYRYITVYDDVGTGCHRADIIDGLTFVTVTVRNMHVSNDQCMTPLNCTLKQEQH